MAAPVTIFGANGEAISSISRVSDNPTGTGLPIRLGSRGEQFSMNLWNGSQGLGMEGSYWTASTATPGTGITLTVATGTTFADTQALLVLNNTDTLLTSGGTGKSIYLDFITVVVTTSPTSATNWHIAHRIDSATRGTTGTALGATGTSPKSMNMNFGANSVGQAFALGASAVSVAASGNVRNVGRNQLRTIAPAVGDTLTIKFASVEMAAGGVGLNTANAQGITVFAGPVIIGPQQSYVCNEWSAARSAALSGEVVMGWVER